MLAQAQQLNLFNGDNGSSGLWTKLVLAFVVGFALLIACFFLPTRARRPVVASFTFLSGAYWVIFYLWPRPFFRGALDEPEGFVDRVGFWLSDANPIVGNLANIISAFILGLGVYSLARIHTKRVAKMQKDWFFSIVLLASIGLMMLFGYWDWYHRKFNDPQGAFALVDNWGLVQYMRDVLFDGLLQVMDAGMFSMIAFFILSAAYRAFRIRSVEATILLAAALIMMLSLMGGLVVWWDGRIDAIGGSEPGSFVNNLRLSDIAGWLRGNLQTPSIRAIEFGIGIGALSMGLRLWLSLERGAGGT